MTHAVPFFMLAPAWRTAFWVSYDAWFLVELAIFIRDRRRVSGENRDRGSLVMMFFLIGSGIAGAFTLGNMAADARMAFPPKIVFPLGIALMWAGMALRLWAVATLGRFFRFSVVVQDDHKLVTAGPYRILRNPSYTGGLITVIGLGLAFGNWASLIILCFCMLLAYAIRIRIEDAALRERFGEAYEQYVGRTWALIPWVW
jgi:protein-S-isoprenylcysteine O-methyltransferase